MGVRAAPLSRRPPAKTAHSVLQGFEISRFGKAVIWAYLVLFGAIWPYFAIFARALCYFALFGMARSVAELRRRWKCLCDEIARQMVKATLRNISLVSVMAGLVPRLSGSTDNDKNRIETIAFENEVRF